jgi:hypothetical protein
MKTIQVPKKTLAMRAFALALAIVTLNAIPAMAQETPARTLVKHVLNGTYYDAVGGTMASCNTQNCLATSNIYTESISCPGAIGVKCTYEVSIWAFTGLQSGVGLYQFLVDGGSPNGGGTDQNGFFNWGQGQNGGGLSVSSAYSVNSQVTNAGANQSHTIVVNLGCDMGNNGCFAAMGSSTLTVRVLKP